MRKLLSTLLPAAVRRGLRLQQRFWSDVRAGRRRHFVQASGARVHHPFQMEVALRIAPGPTLEAKLHNMRKAIADLQYLEIPPGGILSFWHIVGNPSAGRGFMPGRNIVGGKLVRAYGGGLCQLSSALYELTLCSGLELLERHAHSTNVYTPETLYTPLGLDATLAYGYKDLRLRNNRPWPVCFAFDLTEARLISYLCCPEPLPRYELRVAQEQLPDGLVSVVYRQEADGEQVVSRNTYANAAGDLGHL